MRLKLAACAALGALATGCDFRIGRSTARAKARIRAGLLTAGRAGRERWIDRRNTLAQKIPCDFDIHLIALNLANPVAAKLHCHQALIGGGHDTNLAAARSITSPSSVMISRASCLDIQSPFILGTTCRMLFSNLSTLGRRHRGL